MQAKIRRTGKRVSVTRFPKTVNKVNYYVDDNSERVFTEYELTNIQRWSTSITLTEECGESGMRRASTTMTTQRKRRQEGKCMNLTDGDIRMPHYQNDMMHCYQDSCKKKDQCYRFWLGENIKYSGWKCASFFNSDKPITNGCEFYIKKEYFE